MSVAVIDATVISVRLPDLLCAGREVREDDPREADFEPIPDPVIIPDRFFPSDPTAQELAEGIAHHQAATARSASEQLRTHLREVESLPDTEPEEAAQTGDEGDHGEARQSTRHKAREREHQGRKLVLDMTATVDTLDRQVSRVLRRFGSYGTGSDTSGARASRPGLVPQETSLRYRFALDEIRATVEAIVGFLPD
jgi:hypothetical protein